MVDWAHRDPMSGNLATRHSLESSPSGLAPGDSSGVLYLRCGWRIMRENPEGAQSGAITSSYKDQIFWARPSRRRQRPKSEKAEDDGWMDDFFYVSMRSIYCFSFFTFVLDQIQPADGEREKLLWGSKSEFKALRWDKVSEENVFNYSLSCWQAMKK